jgi:hypothetical protein
VRTEQLKHLVLELPLLAIQQRLQHMRLEHWKLPVNATTRLQLHTSFRHAVR